MIRTEYERVKHPSANWELIRLSCIDADSDETLSSMAFVPELGSNLVSFQVSGTEYIFDMAPLPTGPMVLGTPILYPMPNRVRDAVFTFEGREYRFEPNNNGHFLHGLVRETLWEVGAPAMFGETIRISTWITFEPGAPFWELFPIRNRLELVYTLTPDSLQLDFTVRNQDEAQNLPFGLAIHPYFQILGSREQVRIQVPATKWMEAIDLLPTGELLDLADGPADLTEPTPLTNLDLDDVFWGLSQDRVQAVYFDALGTVLTLTASDFFTHSVVYTPQGRPFFCIENQSCSTDAHNLAAKGLVEAAHLTVLAPGESVTESIVMAVAEQ